VYVLPDSFREMGAFYSEIEETPIILLTRIAAHNNRKVNNGDLSINITFNYLETMKMSRQPE